MISAKKGVEPNKSTLAIADSVGISKPCSATLGQPENAVGPRRKPGKSVRPLIYDRGLTPNLPPASSNGEQAINIVIIVENPYPGTYLRIMFAKRDLNIGIDD